jgi:hypothetical protein
LGNLQISTLFDGKKLYGQKKKTVTKDPCWVETIFTCFFGTSGLGTNPSIVENHYAEFVWLRIHMKHINKNHRTQSQSH